MGCGGSKPQAPPSVTPTPSAPDSAAVVAPVVAAPAAASATAPSTAAAAPAPPSADDAAKLAALHKRLETLREWSAGADSRLDAVEAAIEAVGPSGEPNGAKPTLAAAAAAAEEVAKSPRAVVRRESAFGRDFALSPEQAQDVFVLQENFPQSPTHKILQAYNDSKCDIIASIDTLTQEADA